MGTNRNARPEALHDARRHGVAEIDFEAEVRHLVQAVRGNQQTEDHSQRASIRESSTPTIGIITMMAKPPGDSAIPLCMAV